MGNLMNRLRLLLIVFLMTPFTGSVVSAAQVTGIGEKTLLQVGMQKHIDDHLVDGVYLHMKKDTGEVRELHPVKAHPMILQMGKFFVLCSHFKDKDGKEANVDFYMARRGNSYVVFQTLVDDRKPLQRLMKAGKVTRLN